MSRTEESFAFRPLAEGDLPLLLRWFGAPHARRWYGRGGTLEEVEREYRPCIAGQVPVHALVVLHQGRPIGLVEWERMGDTPELQRAYGIADPDTANCDILIGAADAAHRGLGAALVREFLARHIFADPRITRCVIDPQTDNAIAIRAYEKAGFRFLRAEPEDGEGNALYLMELTRQEFYGAPPAPPACYLRPARPGEVSLARQIDDDACTLYAQAGLPLDFPADHPFPQAELARWGAAARDGRLLFACTREGVPVAFAALGHLDGRPFLFQLSVRRAFQRRGLGRMLVERARRWSVRAGELWLTTYDPIAWNGPFYRRLGFVPVAEAGWGPELRAHFAAECAALPAGEQRIAMRWRHRGGPPGAS